MALLPRTASSTRRLAATRTESPAKSVRVYEKVRSGIWVFNGSFRLLDAWAEEIDGRRVFKFRLETDPDATPVTDSREPMEAAGIEPASAAAPAERLQA